MAKTVAYVLGAILTLVGIWGFVQNPVLGLFDANSMHSVVHLLSGLVLLAAAMWWGGSVAWALIVLGAVYALVAVLGLVMEGPVLGLIDNSAADNWLHVLLAVVFLGAGFMGRGSSSNEAPMGSNTM